MMQKYPYTYILAGGKIIHKIKSWKWNFPTKEFINVYPWQLLSNFPIWTFQRSRPFMIPLPCLSQHWMFRQQSLFSLVKNGFFGRLYLASLSSWVRPSLYGWTFVYLLTIHSQLLNHCLSLKLLFGRLPMLMSPRPRTSSHWHHQSTSRQQTTLSR